MLGIIYIITNDINNKVYIGQTIQELQKRWHRHCQKSCSNAEEKMAIKQAILKYGKEHFKIQELCKCPVEELNNKEIYYINLYNSYKKGYNSTIGGQSSTKPLKLISEQEPIIELYKLGFSLREIANEYQVDKATIKHIIEINNIPIRTIRTYKFSAEDRLSILNAYNNEVPRKQIMNEWNISKSYLSQLISGKRRI